VGRRGRAGERQRWTGRPTLRVLVEAGMGPFCWGADEAVFDGIVIDVGNVVIKIALVANQVFPESALPYGFFSLLQARGRWGVLVRFCTTTADVRFD